MAVYRDSSFYLDEIQILERDIPLKMNQSVERVMNTDSSDLARYPDIILAPSEKSFKRTINRAFNRARELFLSKEERQIRNMLRALDEMSRSKRKMGGYARRLYCMDNGPDVARPVSSGSVDPPAALAPMVDTVSVDVTVDYHNVVSYSPRQNLSVGLKNTPEPLTDCQSVLCALTDRVDDIDIQVPAMTPCSNITEELNRYAWIFAY